VVILGLLLLFDLLKLVPHTASRWSSKRPL